MKGEKEEVLNVTVYPDTSELQILYLLLSLSFYLKCFHIWDN